MPRRQLNSKSSTYSVKRATVRVRQAPLLQHVDDVTRPQKCRPQHRLHQPPHCDPHPTRGRRALSGSPFSESTGIVIRKCENRAAAPRCEAEACVSVSAFLPERSAGPGRMGGRVSPTLIANMDGGHDNVRWTFVVAVTRHRSTPRRRLPGAPDVVSTTQQTVRCYDLG